MTLAAAMRRVLVILMFPPEIGTVGRPCEPLLRVRRCTTSRERVRTNAGGARGTVRGAGRKPGLSPTTGG